MASELPKINFQTIQNILGQSFKGFPFVFPDFQMNLKNRW